MSYSNATFYLDLVNGSDAARTALTTVTVSNPSGSVTRCNKTAHGLVTGAVVTLSAFSAWLNADWKITVVDADNFDLDGAVWQSTADNNGTVTPFGGSSLADAWKTITSGPTAAHIAPGDTIRIKQSPSPTLVGDATWTQYSKTITLASAVTLNIATCETAWTGSANVTQTADATTFKEGTKSAKSVIAAAFTTGLVAYFATGTLDLSAYQQVSFWFYNTLAIAASTLSLRLCSDTAGVTTVHTIAIPAVPSANQWVPITVDLGSNMNSAIASVALYADLDPGTVNIQLDNIIACKASSSADSLTLTSLIGKIWNLSWTASTTYASNDIRRPSQPNRNGFRYKVTAGGGGSSGSSEPTWPLYIGATVTDGALTWTCDSQEDTWYGIQSINGTTVKLDNVNNTLGSAGRGYYDTTETVATYKRETIKLTMVSGATTSSHTVQDAGNIVAGVPTYITFSGGWSTSDMSAQVDETWMDGQNGTGRAMHLNSKNYLSLANLNVVRTDTPHGWDSPNLLLNNMHANNCALLNSTSQPGVNVVTGVVWNNCGATMPLQQSGGTVYLSRVAGHSNLSSGLTASNPNFSRHVWRDISAKNNGAYGVALTAAGIVVAYNLATANNANSASIDINGGGGITVFNAALGDTFDTSAGTDYRDIYAWIQKNDGVVDSHVGWTDGGSIISATDQRHTASGISWKFRPTSTIRHSSYPLRLSVAKVACVANLAVTLKIWTRRDNTNISGRLKVAGAQIGGVPLDVTVTCAPSVNTWTQSSALTFTPTENGVVEVVFECWDGVGTTNNMWIDDLSVT